MIRIVLPDVIALVIFSIGGALYGLLLIRITPHPLSSLKGNLLDFFVGILGGLIFLTLTEFYYHSIVTPYTAFCYLIGCLGILLFFSERKPKPNHDKTSLISSCLKKMGGKKKIKKQNKTPKLKKQSSGNS